MFTISFHLDIAPVTNRMDNITMIFNEMICKDIKRCMHMHICIDIVLNYRYGVKNS